MGRTIPSFRIASTLEQKEWKPFRNSLDKSDRKIFDEMFSIAHLYNSASSYAVFSGIATVTMKDGPHIGVPISISIFNQRAMSIWIDPSTTNNHLGNAPIYGTVGLII